MSIVLCRLFLAVEEPPSNYISQENDAETGYKITPNTLFKIFHLEITHPFVDNFE